MEKIKAIDSIAFLIGLTLIIVGIAVISDTWSFTQGKVDDYSSEDGFVDDYIVQEFDCNKGDKIKGEIKSDKVKNEGNEERNYPFDIYIINQENFEKFREEEGLEYGLVRKNIEKIKIDFKVPKSGKWYVIIDNTEIVEGAKEGDLDLVVEYYIKRDTNYKYVPIIIGGILVGLAVYIKFFYYCEKY